MLYQLRDRGALPQGLDTTVASILPGYVAPVSPYRSTRGLTLRALATHSSGLVREVPEPCGASESCTEAEILTAVGNSTVLFEQFARTAYSNLGLAMLGRALEKVSGVTWETWVQREILAPLGMERSGTNYTAGVRSFIVDGVDPVDGARAALPSPGHTSWAAPCGAMYSTSDDMAHWMAFLMGDHPSGDAVLDSATLLEMHSTTQMQRDGLSGIGGATFEQLRIGTRWASTKLGCQDGRV